MLQAKNKKCEIIRILLPAREPYHPQWAGLHTPLKVIKMMSHRNAQSLIPGEIQDSVKLTALSQAYLGTHVLEG